MNFTRIYLTGLVTLIVALMAYMTLIVMSGGGFTLWARNWKTKQFYRASPTHTGLFFLVLAAIWPIGLPAVTFAILFQKPRPDLDDQG